MVPARSVKRLLLMAATSANVAKTLRQAERSSSDRAGAAMPTSSACGASRRPWRAARGLHRRCRSSSCCHGRDRGVARISDQGDHARHCHIPAQAARCADTTATRSTADLAARGAWPLVGRFAPASGSWAFVRRCPVHRGMRKGCPALIVIHRIRPNIIARNLEGAVSRRLRFSKVYTSRPLKKVLEKQYSSTSSMPKATVFRQLDQST